LIDSGIKIIELLRILGIKPLFENSYLGFQE